MQHGRAQRFGHETLPPSGSGLGYDYRDANLGRCGLLGPGCASRVFAWLSAKVALEPFAQCVRQNRGLRRPGTSEYGACDPYGGKLSKAESPRLGVPGWGMPRCCPAEPPGLWARNEFSGITGVAPWGGPAAKGLIAPA